MLCNKCNKVIDNDSKFCTECGAPIKSSNETNQEEITNSTTVESHEQKSSTNLDNINEYNDKEDTSTKPQFTLDLSNQNFNTSNETNDKEDSSAKPQFTLDLSNQNFNTSNETNDKGDSSTKSKFTLDLTNQNFNTSNESSSKDSAANSKYNTQDMFSEFLSNILKYMKNFYSNLFVNRNSKSTNKLNKKNLFALGGILGFCLLVILSMNFVDFINGNITMSDSYTSFTEKEYSEVVNDLEKSGFVNINLNEINDLTDSMYHNNVSNISINGNSTFEQGDKFNKNDEIILTYNTVIEINFPLSEEDIINNHFNDVSNELLNAGYNNVNVIPLNNLEIGDENNLMVKNIETDNNIDIYGNESLPIDTEFNIYYHSLKKIAVPVSSSEMFNENYEQYVTLFTEYGFTNVRTEKIEDLITGWITQDGSIEKVTIDGIESFDKSDLFVPTSEVVIYYHTFPEYNTDDDSESNEDNSDNSIQSFTHEEIELLSTFPLENAKRAAVVSLTNNFADDVFSSDGNSRDETKFHNYSDLSGYHLTLHDLGVWNSYDNISWTVTDMVLEASSGIYLRASLNVSFDGTNYHITEGDIIIANYQYLYSDDPSKVTEETIVQNPNNTYLTVSPSMIIEDRENDIYFNIDDSPVDFTYEEQDLSTDNNDNSNSSTSSRDDWIYEQFSLWDGAHKELQELVISNLHNENSYEHTETRYIDVNSEENLNLVNNILSSANYSERVNIDDIFIISDFTAKNLYDATVKHTAYAIMRYDTNTLELIAIE